MELKSLAIGRKEVKFSVVAAPDKDNPASAPDDVKITSHQAPLISLTNAMSKLAPVMCEICEWPPEYADMLSVTKLTVIYTKAGTRSVKFKASKQLECRTDYLHTFESPFVQIDKPADGESGDVQVSKKHAELITKAIKECEKYASGERDKNAINFDQAKAALQLTADQGKDLLSGVGN